MWNHSGASRYGPTVLTFLALIGISIFIAYFIIAFPNGGGRHYEYSSPLAAMWTGIGTLWFSISFLAWWTLSRNLTTRSLDSQQGLWTLYVWSLYSMMFAVEGFVALIGWALAKNEAVTSGLSVLWVLAGGLAASMTVDLILVKRRIVVASTHVTLPDVEDGTTTENEQDKVQTNKKGRCSRCSCWCTKRFWVDFVFLFLTTFLLIFSTGFMMQGISSASDANMIPPGTIHSFPLTMNDGSVMNVQMHLYCMGEKNLTNDSPTVILEHGGGANSMTMLALAQELETKYQTRTCVYDRLGYGYTPTYYTNDDGRLPNPGVILAQLLQVAGEQGPFVCAGHSAGGEFCLWFALIASNDVTGVALMDGYPDIIRPGSFRPGIPLKGNDDGPLGSIQSLAVMAGGTGLTRGLVGDPGPNFVPFSSRQTVKSLYGQARFWFSQYWDVRSDVEMEESSRLYQQLNGTIGNNGLVTYGRTLSGTKVLVLPAESTVAALDCDGKDNGSYCCGSAKDSTICQDQALDRSIYRAQNDLYASTLGSNGLVIQGPVGSEHDFVNHKDYYQWAANQIGEQLLLQ